MIPNKNKAKLLTASHDDTKSLALNWTGLALAVIFLVFATVVGG